MAKRSPKLLLVLLLAAPFFHAAAHAAAEGQWAVPAALADWKDESYKQRYFLEVKAPGEAGYTGFFGDAQFACVSLPLKTFQDGNGAMRPEPLLLVGEDGAAHAIVPKVVGGDVEIYFRSLQGLRRFCLYAGFEKTDKVPLPKKISPVSNEKPRDSMRMRARSAPPTFAYTPETPLTLERFIAMEKANEGALKDKLGDGITRDRLDNHAFCIDQPQVPVPYFDVQVTIFGHIRSVLNPKNFTTCFDGCFRAPVAGTYAFSLDTLGAAHVVINGTPVVSVDAPDANRQPFTLQGKVELGEGVHRISVYYAEAGNPAGPTNLDLQRFGLRLHWKPPFASDFMCMPPQAFVRSMPAIVARYESAKDYSEPYIHVERLGHVRAGSHLGPRYEAERVLIVARAVGAPPDATLLVTAQGASAASGGPTGWVASWVPAGSAVQLGISGSHCVRNINIPVAASGLPPDCINLEGEMSLKSAPEFLYPNETGHLHLETMLSTAPQLIYKERLEAKLIPPPARPMGQFRVFSNINDGQSPLAAKDQETTPLDGPRKKLRVSFPYPQLEQLAQSGQATLQLRLTVGGVDVEEQRVRLLHSTAPWPGTVVPGPGLLYYTPRTPAAGETFRIEEMNVAPGPQAADAKANANLLGLNDLERVMVLVPEENEAEYRRFAPLKNLLTRTELGDEALFLGDPLVEGPQPKISELQGLGLRLPPVFKEFKWSGACTPGPHRHLPIYRIISALESYVGARANKTVPGLVIVSLGGGDAARQTPLHSFERGVDALIDRLRVAGARRVVFIGVVPEPFREDNSRIYQERLADVLRRHHTDGVDVQNAWTRETDWIRRYSIDATAGENALYGSTLNGAALDELAKMTRDRL